jgi:hypothetical protein
MALKFFLLAGISLFLILLAAVWLAFHLEVSHPYLSEGLNWLITVAVCTWIIRVEKS